MPRLLLLLLLLPAVAAAEPPCASLAACEKACTPKTTSACTYAVEQLMDGKRGFPLDHAKSFRLAKRACDAKDAFGCALLGLHYQDGLGTAYAPKQAVATYDKACRGGAGVGCYNLASMYYGAHGVPFDQAKGDAYKQRARTHWEAACKGAQPRWCTNLAFLDAPTTKAPADAQARSLELNTRACDHGVTVGCLEAARARFELKKIDAATFVAELDKLCTGAEPAACGVIAAFLVLGEHGVPKHPKRGMELLARGCDGGDKHSCFQLGVESAAGQHVKQDFAATTRAFERACDRALSKACVAIAQNLAANRDYARAAAFARRGCHMGNAEGCGVVAQLHADGSGVAKSIAQSTTWATAGCRMGHMPSCGLLIKRDVYPLPVPPEMQKRFYESACKEAKLEPACKRLAKLKVPG